MRKSWTGRSPGKPVSPTVELWVVQSLGQGFHKFGKSGNPHPLTPAVWHRFRRLVPQGSPCGDDVPKEHWNDILRNVAKQPCLATRVTKPVDSGLDNSCHLPDDGGLRPPRLVTPLRHVTACPTGVFCKDRLIQASASDKGDGLSLPR